MKSDLHKLSVLALLPAAWLILTGCSSTPKVEKTTTTAFQEGVPGGTLTQTYQADATVTAIDPVTRQVTLTAPDSSQNTFMAGPKVVLDQIKAGDKVKVTVARELVVYLNHNDLPASTSPAAMVGATPGVRPGVLTADTVELTATVEAIEMPKHEATLHISDGRTGTFKVRQDVDLAQMKPGTTVYIRITAAAAIMLEKP
jgi:translation elongation factor P/translation initiation factor 5A